MFAAEYRTGGYEKAQTAINRNAGRRPAGRGTSDRLRHQYGRERYRT
jgi:hypothetical protein